MKKFLTLSCATFIISSCATNDSLSIQQPITSQDQISSSQMNPISTIKISLSKQSNINLHSMIPLALANIQVTGSSTQNYETDGIMRNLKDNNFTGVLSFICFDKDKNMYLGDSSIFDDNFNKADLYKIGTYSIKGINKSTKSSIVDYSLSADNSFQMMWKGKSNSQLRFNIKKDLKPVHKMMSQMILVSELK